MKTAIVPIKVAAIVLLIGLLVGPAQAQTKYDLSGTSPESRRVFNRVLGNSRSSWNPFRRSTTRRTVVVQPQQQSNGGRTQTSETTVVVQPGGPNQAAVVQSTTTTAKSGKLITISLRSAPIIAINTANGGDGYAGFRPNGFGIRYSIGPTVDYFFYGDRYAFSSGLWFTVRRSGYQMPGSFGQPRFQPGLPDQKSVYNLQYLQVPLLLKLFAKDLRRGIQLYAQTGGVIGVRTVEIGLDKARNGLYQFADLTGNYRDQYLPADIDWLMGFGIHYRLGSNSALNLGMSYQRGMTSVAVADDLDSRLRSLSIDLGFTF